MGAASTIAFVCGAVPAARATRVDVSRSLSGWSARITSSDERLRRAFVVAQVALSVVLAIAGGLVLRSAFALQAAPRGYDANGLMSATVGLPASLTDAASVARFAERVRAEVGGLPGITRVAVSTRMPLGGDTVGSNVALAGDPLTDGDGQQVRIRLVSADYAAATGLRIVAGRDLTSADDTRSARVVVVNRTLARRLMSSEDVVGRAISFEVQPFRRAATAWTIVGVVEDWLDRGPRAETQPQVFVPIAQSPPEVLAWVNRQFVLAIRSDLPAGDQATSVRNAIARVDPQAPVGQVASLEAQQQMLFARERVASGLLTTSGAIGLLLAGLGLFGVVNHLVRRKSLEIALRLALGGEPRVLVRDFVSDGLRLTSVGVAIGLAASIAASRALSSLLYGIDRFDIPTYGLVTAVVFAGATVATWWPARRSVRVDVNATLQGR
jgi:predicted permease